MVGLVAGLAGGLQSSQRFRHRPARDVNRSAVRAQREAAREQGNDRRAACGQFVGLEETFRRVDVQVVRDIDDVRDQVNLQLEEKRKDKTITANLSARVTVEADGDLDPSAVTRLVTLLRSEDLLDTRAVNVRKLVRRALDPTPTPHEPERTP